LHRQVDTSRGVIVETSDDVGVHVQGHAHVGMSQALSCHVTVDASSERQGCGGVPEIVKPHRAW
jgi:hypothetical protein